MRGMSCDTMLPAISVQCVPTHCVSADFDHLYADPWAPKLSTLVSRHRQPTGRAWYVSGQHYVEAVAWFSKVVDEAELLDIRVSTASRGRGLGGHLLHYAQNQLAQEGVREGHLEVRASNLVAQRLYARLGWVTSGRRSDYYACDAGREDAILMTLTLAIYD